MTIKLTPALQAPEPARQLSVPEVESVKVIAPDIAATVELETSAVQKGSPLDLELVANRLELIVKAQFPEV